MKRSDGVSLRLVSEFSPTTQLLEFLRVLGCEAVPLAQMSEPQSCIGEGKAAARVARLVHMAGRGY